MTTAMQKPAKNPAANPIISLIVLGLLAACGAPVSAQTLAPAPFLLVQDNSGRIVNGGCVWTYSAGTSTLATTYADGGLTTPNSNPIIASSAGRFTAFLTNGANYKFVYENTPCSAISHGTTLATVDNVRAVPTADATVLRNLAEGRLTLTSATPVTTGDVSAATTIYYTPYIGNRVALYDGTASWNVRTFSEVTISTAGCTASKPYDVWLYDNGGTVTGEILAWTNATTRATALTRQDGVYVKSGASTRRYVGSFYCNATGGQTDDTAAKRYVWNYYNRVRRSMRVSDATSTWTYNVAAYRQANANAANQLDVMVGVAEVTMVAEVKVGVANTNAGVLAIVGIGEDSTTVVATNCVQSYQLTFRASTIQQMNSLLVTMPAAGRHFYAWLELSDTTITTTFQGSNIGSGMLGSLEN